MSRQPLTIATCQIPVSRDIGANAAEIERQLEIATRNGAHLAHFCEGALSGYAKAQITTWSGYDFAELEKQTRRIRSACGRLGIWAVFGTAEPSSIADRPFNALLAINNQGDVTARYDKRFCSHTERTGWYTCGKDPIVIDVCGMRLGMALCIEIQFPEVFMQYEALGADCVLFSSYSDKAMFTVQAQGHAACNCLWISAATPSGGQEQASCLIGPDGQVISKAAPEGPQTLIGRIDPEDRAWEIPLHHARPWRRSAREAVDRSEG